MGGCCWAPPRWSADPALVIASAYLAADGYDGPLGEALARRGVRVDAWHGRLALSPDPPLDIPWALDSWTDPRELAAPSIAVAAAALRAMQRNWALLPLLHHRRSTLIAERLPPVGAKPLLFPQPAPTASLGGWTLLAPDQMLASPARASPFVNGKCRFVEDRLGPPSRAYLKLWEACTLFGEAPRPGQSCLDLGAAPGGWTWAIAREGAAVLAVDRAALAPTVAAMPGVRHLQADAFTLRPNAVEPVDWLFSDVVAYPARLLALTEAWIAAGRAARIVVTLKFQGPTDHVTAEAFAAIAGGKLRHLFHNKHELTFLWRRPATVPT